MSSFQEQLDELFPDSTDEDCKEALERLQTGQSEVSYRNNIPLNIEWTETI